jgi:secreted trypsin-like serine protease
METEVVTQPIINGVAATDPHHASVVSLHRKLVTGAFSTHIYCSGTLIAPNVVLTAAHCLDVANGGKVFKTLSPSSLAVYFGSDPTSSSEPFAGHHVLVAQTLIHPSYDRNQLINDLGLIRLSAPGPAAPVSALPAASGITAADVGTNLDFAGFGYSQTNPKAGIDVKLHALQPLGGLGCTVSGCPSSTVTNSTVLATQISYAQDPEGPCNGDSGGPAFLQRSGTWYVAGITSYGDSACTVYGASTRVDAFASFIDNFIYCSADGSCNASCTSDPDCVPACGPADGVCPAGCTSDPDCTSSCLPSGTSCSSNGQCCSVSCNKKTKTCR